MKTVKSVLTITIVCSLFSFILFLFGCFINDDSTFCKVVYIAGEGGTIDGIAEQEIRYGEDATAVVAVPDVGYKFVKWSDGKENADRKDINITSSISVVAEFEFLYGGGSGTAFSTYLIENYTHLQNMSYYPDAYYKLVNDLDLAGIDNEPIFDDINYFDGSFNGNNHTIKNLTVNTESNFPSLFGFIGNGSVSYFNLVNVSVKTVNFNTVEAKHNYCVGTIAGVSYGFIHDITVSGTIIADGLYYDGIAIGGLIGMAGGTIANCATDIQIEISNIQRNNDTGITIPYVFGGLVGVGDSALIRESGASGTITLTESYPKEGATGGLIGYYFTSREVETSIKDCTTNVEIYGDTYYDAGGFIGRVYVSNNTSLQILNSAVYGDITMGNVGGFIGRGSCFGVLNIEKCHTEGVINILSRGAGFIFMYDSNSMANVLIKDCYSCGDIVGGADSSKEGLYSGSAAGFCFDVTNLNLINCFASNNIFANRGYGFTFSSYKTHIERCYYIGTIFAKNASGFTYAINYGTIKNCFSNSTFVNSENGDKIYGFAGVIQNSDLINCYCVGDAPSNVIHSLRNSNIINFHTFFTATDGSEVIGQIINELGLPIDITIYEKIEEMYFIAEKLNDEEEEVWINVENNLPQLIYEFEIKMCS